MMNYFPSQPPIDAYKTALRNQKRCDIPKNFEQIQKIRRICLETPLPEEMFAPKPKIQPKPTQKKNPSQSIEDIFAELNQKHGINPHEGPKRGGINQIPTRNDYANLGVEPDEDD